MRNLPYVVPLVGIIVLSALNSQAQNAVTSEPDVSKVAVYADLIIGVINSATINIEGKLLSSDSDRTHLYLRGGYGAQVVLLAEGGPGVLGALTMLRRRGKNYLDISGGVFVGNDKANGRFTLPVIDLGYRWQKPDGGFIFRAKVGVLGIGFGVGYAF